MVKVKPSAYNVRGEGDWSTTSVGVGGIVTHSVLLVRISVQLTDLGSNVKNNCLGFLHRVPR